MLFDVLLCCKGKGIIKYYINFLHPLLRLLPILNLTQFPLEGLRSKQILT